jgi:hypothetical protein
MKRRETERRGYLNMAGAAWMPEAPVAPALNKTRIAEFIETISH